MDGRGYADAKTDLPEESSLCHFCRAKGIWERLSTIKVLGPADWIHEFITDLEDVHNPDRRCCPFCKMVFDVLPETAFAEEHRHMYRPESGAKNYCSFRPVAIKVRKEVFTAFVVTYFFREYISHSSKVFQNYRATIGLGSRARRCFNTLGIASVKLQDTLDPALIRRWISRCQRSHEFCTETQQRVTHRSLRTMMIDVNGSCLVEASTRVRYAALSYVWGQVQSLQTTKANVGTLMTPGSLRRDDVCNQLPRVIQDCIKLGAMKNRRFILLKTIPAESTNGCIGNLFESHGDFRSLFQGSKGESFCIDLLIWVSGKYAERQGVAILGKTFWDSRNPVLHELRRRTTLDSAVSISQSPRRLHQSCKPTNWVLASGVSPVGTNGLAIESGVIRVLCHGGYAQSE